MVTYKNRLLISILACAVAANATAGKPVKNQPEPDLVCDGCVDTTDIATEAVSTDKIQDDAVTSVKIATSAIGVTEVISNQVQLRVAGSCPRGTFMESVNEDGSVTCNGLSIPEKNIYLGEYALRSNTTGTLNAAFGIDALQSNTSGYNNTAFGNQTLTYNVDGYNNTALGDRGLTFNTSGPNNTAVGGGALHVNTSGGDNTAVGIVTLRSNTTGSANTALGSRAMYGSLEGDHNVAVGYHALYLANRGSMNTSLGVDSMYNNETGSLNTAIGKAAGGRWLSGWYNIAIGADVEGQPDDTLTIRIGTGQTRTFIAGIRGRTTGSADTVGVIIDGNGQLGTVSSSARYKEDIHDMGDASTRLLQLRPVTFRYKEPYENGEKPLDYGLIAEEVAEVFPELVVPNEEGQPETVKYRLLSTLLLNELQKQVQLNEQQNSRLDEMAELKSQVAELSILVTQLAKSGDLNQEMLVANADAD